MFSMIGNLAKAAVSVAVTPVALAADIISLPSDADSNKDAFHRTRGMLDNAGDCLKKAVEPD